jgi:photosystem II stability/assembly factor-like uncharacterized protein
MDKVYLLATDEGVVIVRENQNVWEEIWWTEILGQATSITVSGSNVLAGTTNGIQLSQDLGQTWRRVNTGLEIEHVRWVTYHPKYPSFVWAGTEPAMIYLSEDGGESWQERPEVAELRDANGWYLPYSPRAGCVRGFAFHGKRGYAAVEQGGVLRSDDRGQSWRSAVGSIPDPHKDVPDGFIHPDVHSVTPHPRSPELVLAPTGGGLYRSQDGGQTWTHLYECYCRAVWVDPEDPQHLIFGPADGVSRNGRIEETVDGGLNWRPASLGLDVPWTECMVERLVDDGQRILAVLSNGEVIGSSLETLSWEQILPEVENVNALAVGYE